MTSVSPPPLPAAAVLELQKSQAVIVEIKVQVLLGRYRSRSPVYMWSAGAVSLTKLLTFSLLHFRSGLRQPVNYHLRLKLWGMTSWGAGKIPLCVCVCVYAHAFVLCLSVGVLGGFWYCLGITANAKQYFTGRTNFAAYLFYPIYIFEQPSWKAVQIEYYANKRKQYKVHWTFLMTEHTQQSEPLTSTISGRQLVQPDSVADCSLSHSKQRVCTFMRKQRE